MEKIFKGNNLLKYISLSVSLVLCASFAFAESCSTVGATQDKYTASGCSYTTQTRTCCSDKTWSSWGGTCVTCDSTKGEHLWNGKCCPPQPPYAGGDPDCWNVETSMGWRIVGTGTIEHKSTNNYCDEAIAKTYLSRITVTNHQWCDSVRQPGKSCSLYCSGKECGASGETCVYSASCSYKKMIPPTGPTGSPTFVFDINYEILECGAGGYKKYTPKWE